LNVWEEIKRRIKAGTGLIRIRSVLDIPYTPPAVRIFQDNNSQFKETIELNSHNLSYGGMMSFPKIFYGTVTQSLISFLIYNDRRRLKRCPVCEKFFIAKNANRDICSTKCQIFNTRDYFKRYMRKKRDKGGPDFDPKYI